MSTRRRIALTGMVMVVVLLALAYGGGSWYFSNVLLARPTRSLAETAVRSERTPAGQGLPAPEEITFNNGDVALAGWYFDNPLDGGCGGVILHGYTGNRIHSLYYAPLFWERGCDLLLYDARGHGDSSSAFHTYGYFEKDDLVAGVKWLMTRADLTESQIGLAGVSYGAATVLQAAPLLPDVAFILADSAYGDMERIVTYQAVEEFGPVVGWLVPGVRFVSQVRTGMVMAEVSPETAVIDATMPIMLSHSLQDTYTFPSHSEAIYANSNQAQTRLYLNDWGAAHGGDVVDFYDRFAANFDEFMAELVPGFGIAP